MISLGRPSSMAFYTSQRVGMTIRCVGRNHINVFSFRLTICLSGIIHNYKQGAQELWFTKIAYTTSYRHKVTKRRHLVYYPRAT